MEKKLTSDSRNVRSHQAVGHLPLIAQPKGPFIIYVSMFLPIFDQLTTLVKGPLISKQNFLSHNFLQKTNQEDRLSFVLTLK